MKRIGRRSVLVTVLAAACAGAAWTAGCKDRIANPTQGFLEVLTGDVVGVEVFVDDVSMGVASRVGPLDAGSYRVRIAKDGFIVVPAETEATVPAGGTEAVAFALELTGPGTIQVTASDEILGTVVTGAEIFLDTGAGWVATGVLTPDPLPGVPPGPARVRVQKAGFQESEPGDVTVVKDQTVDADLLLGPARAVLAEMFTYSFCSGCPAAALKLEEIQHVDPHRVFVVEWHFESRWPLYDSRWNDRRLFYGASTAAPVVIFQGGTDPSHVPPVLEGGDTANLDQYQPRVSDYLAACGNDCTLALKVLGSISASSAEADVRVLFRGGTLPADLVLYVLLSENHILRAHIGGAGNTDEYSFVARDIVEFDETNDDVQFSVPGEIKRWQHTFPINGSWNPPTQNPPSEFHLTAWIQSDATFEVLAVGGF